MQLYNLPDGRPAVHYRGINAIYSHVNKAYNFTFRLHGRVESHGAQNVFAVCDLIDDLIARREAIEPPLHSDSGYVPANVVDPGEEPDPVKRVVTRRCW